jgi:hypothetical protein
VGAACYMPSVPGDAYQTTLPTLAAGRAAAVAQLGALATRLDELPLDAVAEVSRWMISPCAASHARTSKAPPSTEADRERALMARRDQIDVERGVLRLHRQVRRLGRRLGDRLRGCDARDARGCDLHGHRLRGLHVRLGTRFPLGEAAAAHRALEGRATTGKVLLIP